MRTENAERGMRNESSQAKSRSDCRRLSLRQWIHRFVFSQMVFAALIAGNTQAADNSSVALAKQLISALTDHDKAGHWPHLGPLTAWELAIDTYTHDVPSSVIADLYSLACTKLASLYPKEVHSYYWQDANGWPRIATVVQLHNENLGPSCLVVTASQNNDNDGFSFDYLPGMFDTHEKQLRQSWKLPKNHLRSDARKAKGMGGR